MAGTHQKIKSKEAAKLPRPAIAPYLRPVGKKRKAAHSDKKVKPKSASGVCVG